MKNKSIIFWILRRVKKRIPAMVLLVLSSMANAVLGVCFALGSRGVIDGAVSGDKVVFVRACIVQFSIIFGLIITLTINRHLKERLTMDLERDWKRQLLSGLLHGDYAGVSAYHSGELLNRLNNDVRVLNSGIVGILPSLASMVTKLVAAVAVLISIEPKFTFVVLVAGISVILVTAVIRKNLNGLGMRFFAFLRFFRTVILLPADITGVISG